VRTPGEIAVFRCIRQSPGIARVELANMTGLTSAAVSQIVRRLMNAGLVEEGPERYPALGAAGGRARIGLRVGAVRLRALGITVRRFDVLWGLVSLTGELEKSWQTSFDEESHRPLEKISETARAIFDYVQRHELSILTVGIGLPAFGPSWAPREQVVQAISDQFLPTAVYFGRNGSYAALAEDWFFGEQWVKTRWLYVFLGAGIGGALVEHHHPKEMPRINSVETGHVGVDPDGAQCFCGNRGCVELTASPLSLTRLGQLAPGDGFRALRKLRPHLKRAATQMLSYGLVSIVNVLDVETIVIGGLEKSVIESVYGGVVDLLRDRLTPSQRPLNVYISSLGETSSIVGAALGAMDQMGQEVQPMVSSWS
jgi:predicted NBD/HSP70 family sugar kinase